MEDLPILVSHFVGLYSEANGKPISHVSPEAMTLLQNHSWPGNVRELENAIERAVAMSQGAVLFPEDFSGFGPPMDAALAREGATASLEQMEKGHILKVLSETQFNKSKASALLGIDRATLYRKAQRYGIDLSRQ
jgi:DNA-binding NtrC family response regulator